MVAERLCDRSTHVDGSSGDGKDVKKSSLTGASAIAAQAGVCEVLLIGDWAHNCDIKAGETFHVVDFCEMDMENLCTGSVTGVSCGDSRPPEAIPRPTCIYFDVHDPTFVASAELNPVAVVNNASGLIILNPDTLVSPTAISEAVTCQRRTVLSSRIKLSETAIAATLGNFYHDFFEKNSARML